MKRIVTVLAAIAGALGLGYAVKKASAGVPSATSGLQPVPAKPVPEPTPAGAPPEPAGGWASEMPPQVTQQRIIDCMASGVAKTEAELRLCVMVEIFPNMSWVNPQGWQHQALTEAASQIFVAAQVESWPFYASSPRGRDIAVTFWLRSAPTVRECMKQNFTLEQIKTCAAREMFPDDRWPPLPTDLAVLRAVWERLDQVVAEQSS